MIRETEARAQGRPRQTTPEELYPYVLNPDLYARLVETFGDVQIESAGMAAIIENGRVAYAGERYAVHCPFCRSSSPKLSFQHRYGDGENSFSRVICWRTSGDDDCCTGDARNLKDLQRALYPLMIAGGARFAAGLLSGRRVIREGRKPEPVGPMRLPGVRVSLADLTEGHAAVRYLADRGFDAAELARDWQLEYCTSYGLDEDMAGARGRIIIPIYQDGELRYWQGRITEDNLYRPKYYNARGPKGDLLYGFDEARAQGWPFVIVVEGVTDVWRIGPGAVATLGKSLSASQTALIAKTWPTGPVLVFADDTAAWESAEGRYDALRRTGIPVVPFWSADGRDPGAMPTDEAWTVIYAAATDADFDLHSLAT